MPASGSSAASRRRWRRSRARRGSSRPAAPPSAARASRPRPRGRDRRSRARRRAGRPPRGSAWSAGSSGPGRVPGARSPATSRPAPPGRARSSARRGTAPAGGARVPSRRRAAAACRPSTCARAVGCVGEAELLEQLVDARGQRAAAQPVDLALQAQVLAAGGLAVDARALADDADRAPHGGRVATTSWPATRARPESARDSVVRIRTVVDLPAPFGPSSAKIVPPGTARLRPSSARMSPG